MLLRLFAQAAGRSHCTTGQSFFVLCRLCFRETARKTARVGSIYLFGNAILERFLQRNDPLQRITETIAPWRGFVIDPTG
jgi:hypothetical protein